MRTRPTLHRSFAAEKIGIATVERMLGGRRTSRMSHVAILVLLAAVLSASGSGAAAADESASDQDGGSLVLVLDADRPDDPADDEDDVDMGPGWPWFLIGLLVLAGLAAGLLAAIRRRRGKVDAEPGT